MTLTKLSKAIRDKSRQLGEQGADIDTTELLLVLARLVEGLTMPKAFGTPGDWGYGSPLGDGLLDGLKQGLLPAVHKDDPV
jgi:hypothetical protein